MRSISVIVPCDRYGRFLPGCVESILAQPGVDVKEGDYLLAINGDELRGDDDVSRLLMGRAGKQTVIKVGPSADGIFGACRTANLPRPNRQRAAASEQPLRPHLGQLIGIAHLIIERDRLLEPDDDARLIMVLQVGTDLRRIGDNGNSHFAQQRCRPDAG